MLLDLRLGALHEPLTGRRLDSAECTRQVVQRAHFFRGAGMKRGDRVFLHYGNRPEFFIDVAACWLVGACAVPVDPRLTRFEIETLVEATQPAFSIWDRDPDGELAARLRSSKVEILDIHGRAETEQGGLPPGLPRLDDDALILFTSGTTGEPKGVVHTHRSLRARLNSQRDQLGVAAYARTLCLVPTNFAWGLVGNSLFPWMSGQDLYILPAFRSDVLLRLGAICDEHGITCLPSVPALWRTVLRMAAPPRKGTLRRVLSGTGPLPVSMWEDVRRWSGTDDVLNVYGITECGWLTWHSSASGALADGLVGMPYGTLIRVLPVGTTQDDPLRVEPCDAGTPGHVWAQTPALMRGYYGRDDLTDEVVSRGWFVTGDVGMLDERGALHLRGRDKDMINAGGVKVYPADVDVVVARCAAVADVCAFGGSDPVHGEQVSIAVVLHEPGEERLREVYLHARQHLAPFQLPRTWYLVDEIPRTPRGKVSRSQVAQRCAQLRPVDLRALERQGRPAASLASGG